MKNFMKILVVSLLLTACAGQDGAQKESFCKDGFVKIENDQTGQYGCVSQLEWEKIYGDFEDGRY